MRHRRVDPAGADPAVLAEAVAWLRGGGLVVFPTDTFYGVTADPASDAAIEALFEWKGRRPGAALPLVAADRGQVVAWFGALDAASARLAAQHWPGPLSLILPAGTRLSSRVTADGDTVAVRVPEAPVARALARAWGGPLPATSANRSGAPAVTRVDALGDLVRDARVLVLDAGPTPGGAASTIVDARATPPVRVRDGAVPWNRVLESIADADTD